MLRRNINFVELVKTYPFSDSIVSSDGLKVEDWCLPVLVADYDGLDRYIEAQNKRNRYQAALEEVKMGKKKTHWIWYIFPKLDNDRDSNIAKYYGLNSREEAKMYLEHPLLGKRLIEITEAVYNSDKTVYEIFGNDAVKVRSCMLLFASVSDI